METDDKTSVVASVTSKTDTETTESATNFNLQESLPVISKYGTIEKNILNFV